MSIQSGTGRIVATLMAMLQTRLALASIELEEELLRFATYFICALIALFCAGVAITLVIFLMIAAFWDEHRIAILLTLTGLFGMASIAIATWIRKQFVNKPPLLENTIAELKKDAELLRLRDEDQENGT